MTNPGNIVRIRSRNAGRASVYEANMWAQTFSTGLLSGNGVLQNTSANMNVLVGGSPSKPDVVIAKNPAGYNIALDIIGQQAIQITPPASNSRIASIVAYTNDLALASSDTATTGSPSSCGLIVVYGSASATPTPPTEATIRSAITADGATGSQAVYGVIANIPVASSTTTITNALIENLRSRVNFLNLDSSREGFSLLEVDTGTKWVDGKVIYKKTINIGALPNNTTKDVAHGITSLFRIVSMQGMAISGTIELPLPYSGAGSGSAVNSIQIARSGTTINVLTGSNRSAYDGYVTIHYTKD